MLTPPMSSTLSSLSSGWPRANAGTLASSTPAASAMAKAMVAAQAASSSVLATASPRSCVTGAARGVGGPGAPWAAALYPLPVRPGHGRARPRAGGAPPPVRLRGVRGQQRLQRITRDQVHEPEQDHRDRQQRRRDQRQPPP